MSDHAKTMNEANAFARAQARLERAELALTRIRAIASDALSNGPVSEETASDLEDILITVKRALNTTPARSDPRYMDLTDIKDTLDRLLESVEDADNSDDPTDTFEHLATALDDAKDLVRELGYALKEES